jgi:hypothetical protein
MQYSQRRVQDTWKNEEELRVDGLQNRFKARKMGRRKRMVQLCSKC